MSDPGSAQKARHDSTQLPAAALAPEFGKVYVRDDGGTRHVEFLILMPELGGTDAEGWQTGVALDASASMKTWYGRNLAGALTADAAQDYRDKGWLVDAVHDGKRVTAFKKEAYEDAIRRGLLTYTENIVEPLARDFISYLAGQLDADGGTTVIYWACGGDGSLYEVIGDFTADQCKELAINGPQKASFGNGTRLVPAVRYFLDRFKDADRGMYVFLTDGKLDDLAALKAYTTDVAKDIEAGRRKPVKCVLIGLGDEVDKEQMEELDDLDTGTDVDVWDLKIAADLRGVNEIIVELVDGNTIVAPTAAVYDATGATVATFADGLPARATFSMPASSAFFELEVAGRRIKQTVVA